jgi:phospholipase C
MLENRSFDCMLGRLYPKSAEYDGLAGTEVNPAQDGSPVRVWNSPGTDENTMRIPNPDPGEVWTDMNTQLFGVNPIPDPKAVPPMNGFVKNYQMQTDQPPASYVPNLVMHYFMPTQVPVLSALAQQFAVSDRWHASAPCQTWPNRFFVHTGTAGGDEYNSPSDLPFEMMTIYNRIDDKGVTGGWKIYFHDMPQTLTLANLWRRLDGFRMYEEFKHDAQYGTLPAYSFIEPRYFADVDLPNDQHPPHVVTKGEQLIAEVYNSLRGGPAWTKTLLIITYDEHGGIFDHVPPPPAIPPSKTVTEPFNFDRYGVRVPTVIVSPFIRPGTVARPSGPIPFDHTSILATLRKRFELGDALTPRDDVAPDLDSILNLATPDNLGPDHLDALPFVASPADIARAKAIPLNDLQKSLIRLSTLIPSDANQVDSHLAMLRAGGAAGAGDIDVVAAQTAQDATKAVADIKARLNTLFGSL